ncbi:eIF-2-alpha kinase activator GCN1 [Octopus bimaculoides]|uniref:eIF-2-alpha kinase activator GCN1 n=1 Tax=Octopus bimaculoides TaxID=37653 RepID=UPI0022DEA5CF|nr:eIF-2-alpha kinase activator GCN1 [Octopus bimaculoides]
MAERTSPGTQVLTDADILKNFALKVTTSNRNERIELLKLVKKSAANALPENAVKGILRYLLLTLGRYQDRRSQLAVQDVVSQLALKHPQATLKCISASLANFANLQKTCGTSSKAISTESLQALIWTCVVADQVFAPDKCSSTDDLKALVSLQSLLLYGCHSARLNTLNAVAYKHISRLWKKSPATVQLYREYLTSLEGAPHLLSLASLVMQHLHDTKNKECIQACKKPFCDLYLKQVLAYRSTPPLHLLENCQSLLRHVNHEDFNEILQPAAQKATLRNPEIILQAVEYLLIGVQLDMSKYALDLAKPIAKQLFVKEENVRQSASNVLEALARQCSSPDAVDSVTTHLFQVLAGSEGKLISADQRIGVLNGINSLSHHVVSGVAVVQKLTASITERFIPILGQEVHEGTLVCILQALTSWCSRLHTEVPTALVDCFKKGLTLKTSTSAVRNAYICCMVSAFHGDTLLQAQKVVPLLLQVVEKASNQPNQTQLVTEALSASRLLLQLSLADIQYETKLAQFWNVVLDTNKLLFFNDKSLSSLSDEAFLDLIFMVEKLILDFPTMDRIKISKPLYKALVLGLTHSSWLVRKQSMQCLKRVFHFSERLSMVVDIIAELDNVLTSMKIPTTPSLSEDSEEQDPKKINAKVFGNALLALCRIPDPKPSEIETLALAAFVSAHHPIIVSYSKHMWQDILKQLGQNAKTFVKDHSDKCLEIVRNANFETCVENGVASLVSIAPDSFLPQLVAQICDQLELAEFLQVTQDEYGIFRCPEGQLYDKTVLESVLKNEVKETNIRRENKLYSYAEQMAEIELRKEVEKKKRAKGGDMRLTKQQEEKLQMALKKESQIRSNIRMLNNKLVRCCNTLHSAIRGDCNAVCMFMSNLCQVLIPLLYSPLSAAPVSRLLITLGNSAFMDKQFGEMMSHATVRALKPYCQLESQWTQEEEVQQVERLVQLLHDRVQARVGGGPKHPFPASTFAYFFHLLSVALSGQHWPLNDASTTCLRALQLIICHARIRLKTHGGVGGGDDNNNKSSAKSKNSKKRRRKKNKNNENEKNDGGGGGGGGQKKPGEIGDIHQDEQVKIREKVMMMGMVRMEEDMEEEEEKGGGGGGSSGGGDSRLSHEDEEILRKLYDPQLLPHKPLLQLLIKLIGTVTSTKIQELSNTALIEVAHSLSGNMDCAFPSNEDISVMLLALEAPSLSVKRAVLQAMTLLTSVLPNKDDDFEMWLKVVKKIWIAKFDQETEVQELAKVLETKLKIQNPPPKMVTTLIEDVIHPEESVRQAAASTVAAVLQLHKKQVAPMMHQLLDKYGEKLFLPPPEVDSFGRVIGEPVPDDWMSRSGIALCLTKMAPLLPKHLIAPLFAFYVPKALGDRAPEVQTNMRDAALAAVNEHGKDNVNTLLPVFENFLSTAANTASNDAVRQSIVILMGSLAKHLDKSDPKVKPIVARLISALSTPSQEVQIAVSYCLPPLVPAIGADATTIVQQLLRLLLESENYGERKGAAYGLAGLVKGLGIVALKKMGIINTLTEAIKDKKNPRRREGSLFAFEMLCTMLGKLFEPYVVVILPHLLLCFGDHNMYVRQAADDTAKAIMTNLSGHGVKFVLPSLLKGLEEDAWRTKAGSVELLGAMAFCAPKQLSACLPNIVPKLIEVLTDSHNKVQRAGAQALQQIGSVIRNPEIQAIVPVLLAALQDPTQKTYASLQALLDTKFVHFIDAASLALIMPVVERAFQDRTTDTRKMAAQIIGNMYSLTDQKDLSPYLPTVIPGLKQSLLDPVPEVRNVSSRALGTMVRGMGEGTFDDLLPWLMETLVSERSSVDRSGAAQGLSEVIGGMGLAKLQILMPDIVHTADRNDIAPHIRDGYIMMYIYLPLVFKDDFLPYIGQIIPSILKALADESEFVRDTALRAGQRIINMYSSSPSNHVYSTPSSFSLSLGVSGKMSTETANEDDNFGTETSQKAVLRVFGKGRRNRVLAGLYMGRSDTALLVRQSALHVWKIIVSNTPRTLREILPVLFSLLLGCLASTSYDKRQFHSLYLPPQVTVFANNLIPSVRRALCDPLPEVREAAARTFDNLHHNIGARALDEILPTLLQKLSEPESSEWALDGLKQVMTVKSRVVLPYLVPQLIKPPVDTRALAFLSSVAGDVLSRHLGKILPALLSSLSSAIGSPREEEELDYCESVVLSVTDDIGINTILTELLSAANNPNSSAETCCAAVSILKVFCGKTKADYSACCSQLLRTLIALFTHSDERVLLASWKCLDAIAKDLKNMDTGETIQQIRQAIRFATSDYKGTGKELPGFCLSGKSISPLLPIFREGILHGSPELKEMSAEGLGEIIQLTSAPALSPSVINITGPLIRILGDRYPCNVKVAVLETLNLLLNKVGAIMKPFLPQLQTTFTKALNDANRTVRLRAASAMGGLIVIHTRVEPLITELHTNIKTTDDTSIRDTTLQALRNCVGGSKGKINDNLRKTLSGTLLRLLNSPEDTTRLIAAGCLGALTVTLPDSDFTDMMNTHLMDTDNGSDWTLRHGRSVALAVAIKEGAERVLVPSLQPAVFHTVTHFTAADRIPICLSGLRAATYVLSYQITNSLEPSTEILVLLAKGLKHDSNDVKQLCGQLASHLARQTDQPLPAVMMKYLVPALVMGTKEKNFIVKGNSEYGLLAVLQLAKGDSVYQATLSLLDVGMQEALQDVYTKTLRKLLAKTTTPVREEIDDSNMLRSMFIVC